MKTNADTELVSLWRGFGRFFELSLATTEAERSAVYRFRYRIFCEKLGFIDPPAFPDRRETDSFDEHSIHCYVRHRASGKIAGCVRLVAADASKEMPLEGRCRGTLDPAVLRHVRDRRSEVAEISRLAVGCSFRSMRRVTSRDQVSGDLEQGLRNEQQTFPFIAVALMFAAGACADVLHRTECFTLMERSLHLRLRRIGVATTRVGKDIEYKGTVAPYRLALDDAKRSLPQELLPVAGEIRSLVADSIGSAGVLPTPNRVERVPAYAIAG